MSDLALIPRNPGESEWAHTARVADENLHNALVAFTQSIGEALGVCSYGLTIGQDYVPFDADDEDQCNPEEDEDAEAEDSVACTQAWVRVESIVSTSLSEALDGNVCAATLRMSLEVGILRCLLIEDDGEAPKAADVLGAALQSMTDMRRILDAATGPEAPQVWETIVAGQWTPMGPLGGQYGGIWTFTVDL